jgi:hypothetical protein
MKTITVQNRILAALMLVFVLIINANTVQAISTSIIITQDTTISNNTTWNVNNVYVKGNITIPANVTLTIAAGTNVVFNSSAGHYQINVTNGCVKALGTKLLPITFTVSSTAGYTDYTTNSGSWRGFYISNASNLTDSLEFRYCNFFYTKTNSSLSYKAAFQITDCAKIGFQDCLFNNNLRSMNISNSKVYISSSQFLNSFFYALIASIAEGTYKTYSKDFLVSNSKLHMSNCVVTGSCYRTIEANTSSVIKLYNNNFTYQPKLSETYTVTGWDHAIIYSDLSKIYSVKDTFISNTQKLQHALFIRYSSICEIDSAYMNNFNEYGIRYITANGSISNTYITTSAYGIGVAAGVVDINNCYVTNCNEGAYIRQLAIVNVKKTVFKSNNKGLRIEQANVEIEKCKIVNSLSSGALYCIAGKINLYNCLIASNTSTGEGSALYLEESEANIYNSTIAYNRDNVSTAAPLYFKNVKCTTVNTIIWNNTIVATPRQIYIKAGPSFPYIHYSDVQGGQAAIVYEPGVNTSAKIVNSIDTDPMFENISNISGSGNAGGDALVANWALNSASPCINKGLNSSVTKVDDLIENSRIKFGIVDIGAYERISIPNVTAQTLISSNTVWMADTIKVNNNVSVNENISLTISPGTVVQFTGPYHIVCRGLFKAVGLPDHKIKFIRTDTAGLSQTTNQNGSWRGIFIGTYKKYVLSDSINGSIINYYNETDTTEISNCIFTHAKSYITGSNTHIRGILTIRYRTKIKVNNNIFIENSAASTDAYFLCQATCIDFQNNKNAIVTNNEFAKCNMTNGSIVRMEYWNYIFSNNTIHDNTGCMILSLHSSELTLNNNKIFNNLSVKHANPWDGFSRIINASNAVLRMQNNLIFNNTNTEEIINSSTCSDVLIANNTITNNSNSGNVISTNNGIIRNNILNGNLNKTFDLKGTSTISNCLIQPNSIINSGYSFIDCFTGNPGFIKPTISIGKVANIITDYNWQINALSPCVNKGLVGNYDPLIFDIINNPRQNGPIDIGAYENQGTKPTYSIQPKGSNLCEGQSLLLTIATSDTATYQWLKDGNEIAGANNDTLLIATTATDNTGLYQCKARNGYGTVNSDAVQVNVGAIPEILSSPESKFLSIGNPANIEVPVSGTKPLDISWYKNDVLLPLIKKAAITTPAFAIGDEGVYKMKVTNVCGADSTSKFALFAEPKISFTSGIKGFCIGNRNVIKLYKGFSGTITWYRNGSVVENENKDSLVVTKLSKDQEGSYYCVVSNAYGTISTNQLYLVSSEAPAFTRQPLSQWVGSDGSVTLEVASTGSNPLTYKWYRDGQLIDGENSIRYLIGGFSEANEKTYHCEVSNLCGSDISTNAVLKLSPVIKTLTATGEPVVCQGGKFVLKVVFNDTASFQWFKDGVSLPKGKQRILAIDSVSAKHSGNYSCRVSNAYGYEILGPVFLTVAQGATVDALPKITYVNESLQSTIKVNAEGDEPITYKWYKNGIVIDNKTQSSLVLEKLTKSDEALYKCKVENVCNPIETNETRLVIAPQICMVGNLNQLNNKNVIIWDRNSANTYDHYNVYRESSVKNKFDKIGSVPYVAITTFTDSAVNPKTQAFMYKITAVDNTGLETDINATAPHKTIHLLVTQGIPEGIQLDWDDYLGFDYGTYDIFRSIDKAGFVKVYSMSSTSRTYTDTKASNTKDLRYYISVTRSSACSADKLAQKAGAGPFAAAVSNMEDNSRIKFVATGIADLQNGNISVYPNPFYQMAKISYRLDIKSMVDITLTDLSGRTVEKLVQSYQQAGEYNIQVGDKLNQGIYLLKTDIGREKRMFRIVKIK